MIWIIAVLACGAISLGWGAYVYWDSMTPDNRQDFFPSRSEKGDN